jgi:hypothetical protein
LHIPAQGETIELTPANIDLYRHTIVNYELNTLEVRDGKNHLATANVPFRVAAQ